jgi:hypothetical protein
MDAVTHEIVAVELTPDYVGDVSEIPDLLDQIDADVASLTADGAYDSGRKFSSPKRCNPACPVTLGSADKLSAIERQLALSLVRSPRLGSLVRATVGVGMAPQWCGSVASTL